MMTNEQIIAGEIVALLEIAQQNIAAGFGLTVDGLMAAPRMPELDYNVLKNVIAHLACQSVQTAYSDTDSPTIDLTQIEEIAA